MHKSQKIVLAVVGLLLILFLIRGWVRQSAIIAYVEYAYGPSVRKTSEQAAQSTGSLFQPLGLKFTAPFPVFGKTCGLAYYHNFQETVACSSSYDIERIQITDEFAKKWQAAAPAIEQQLTQAGWILQPPQKGEVGVRSLSNVIRAPDGYYANGLRFDIQQNKTNCVLYVSTIYREDYGRMVMDITQACKREVKFFGGSTTIHDDQIGPSQ